MINNRMIEIKQDLDSINYDTGIEIKIISKNFDYPDCFTKLTSSQFNAIMMNESGLSRESILMAFLYINSYIGCRPRNEDGSEKLSDPGTKPEAFWRSIECMAKDLSMSKDTITQCMNYLTTSIGSKEALLIKKEVGSIQTDSKNPPKNVPNIYVINKKGYQQEIEWALKKMLEVYGVAEFAKMKGGKKTSDC